jgi:lysophospholipase L1-like esterase
MQDTSHNLKRALWPIDLLVILSGLLIPAAWLLGRVLIKLGPAKLTVSWGIKPLTIFAVLVALRIAVAIACSKKGTSAKGLIGNKAVGPLLLGIGLLFIILWGWEAKLAHAGFSHETPALVIAGQDKPELKSEWQYRDPELLWSWRPGVMFNGRPVNKMGFLDREVEEEKTEGTTRVICMGCSCTGQGIPPYSGFLHEYLNETEPGKWDAFNMAVHGYSTSQGLRLFQNRGGDLKPDFVTVFYGWNDHWRARAEDSKRMAWRATSQWKGALIKALQKKRFFQYLVKRSTPDYENVLQDDEFVLRVPAPEYRKNLERFLLEIKKTGATPILLAPPRGSTLTPILVKNRQAASVQDAIRLHDEYLEILYEVAEETGTALIDLPELLKSEEESFYFSEDGIHFQREGRMRIAREIQKKLNELLAGS